MLRLWQLAMKSSVPAALLVSPQLLAPPETKGELTAEVIVVALPDLVIRAVAASCQAGCFSSTGKVTTNLVPTPGVLNASIVPR